MELILFITCSYLLFNQYYYFLSTFLLSNIIFEWIVETNDKIFEDKHALILKKTCLKINSYQKNITNIKIYNYLNNKFIFIVLIIKKALINKIEKIYINNYEQNYDKIIMSYFNNFSNFIEPTNKFKNTKINNVDEKIQKYISTFKKPN